MIELVFNDRCTQCGTCEEVCPTNVFDLGADGYPVIARQEECHSCFLCEAHCPGDALYVGPLRTPQPVTREHVLALGVLGNFRRALGFDKHAPGSYCYGGEESVGGQRKTGTDSAEAATAPKNPGDANAAIYAALPINLYFGGMPEVLGSPFVLFALIAVDAYLSLHDRQTLARLWWLFVAFTVAALCDWPTVVLVPVGASFTGVTSIVTVRATGSRSMPPFAVPPSSCTWKVKLAYAAPLAFAPGV